MQQHVSSCALLLVIAALFRNQIAAMSTNSVQPIMVKTPNGAMAGTDEYGRHLFFEDSLHIIYVSPYV